MLIKKKITSKLEWEKFDKSIRLTKTNGQTLILNKGQYIKFIRTLIYNEDGTVKENKEKKKTMCKILDFVGDEGVNKKIRIFFLPYRYEKKRWASSAGVQREIYKQDLDSIEIIDKETIDKETIDKETIDKETIDKESDEGKEEQLNEARKFLQKQKETTKIKSRIPSSGIPCEAFRGKSVCEGEVIVLKKGTTDEKGNILTRDEILRRCEYDANEDPRCKKIENEERRKILTSQYNEEQEIAREGWLEFNKLEPNKSYLPMWNTEAKKKIRNWNTKNAVYVFNEGYYFQKKYYVKSVIETLHENGLFKIKINDEQINLKNILFDLSEKKIRGTAQKKFAEEAKKAKEKFDNNKSNTQPPPPPPSEEIHDGQIVGEALDQKLKDLQKNHDKEMEELKNEHNKNLEKIETSDKKILDKAQKEHEEALEKLTIEQNKKLTNLTKETETKQEQLQNQLNNIQTEKQRLQRQLEKTQGDIQDQEITKRQIERLGEVERTSKKSIEKNKSLIEQLKKEKEEIQATRTENQKAVIELMKIKEEERRKQKEEFLKHKGESLKEAIGNLENNEKFTNMSEIKIAALEDYPTLRKKIINFLVFKEDELIKAHHAKFYSDNIKKNNNKLVETLKLVPSEPFLGIEGLPLVSGFGSNPEQEEKPKEEEIESLKEIKKMVRDFIMSKTEHIFNPSQHEKLSVKEYLKTL